MATSSPNTPPRLVEFFVSEATGYADTLREIMWLPAGDRDTGKMLSSARGMRGAATMVRLSDLAVVAGRMERIARGLHTRRIPWTEPLSYSLQAVLYELPELIAAAAVWGPGESERAAAIADALQAFAPSDERKSGSMVVPIARLYHDDSGPHVIYVAVTPQTQFEQQLREPPPNGAAPSRRPASERSQPTATTGQATRAQATRAQATPAQARPARLERPERPERLERPERPRPATDSGRQVGHDERSTPRGQALHSLISEGLASFSGIDLDDPASAAAAADASNSAADASSSDSLVPIESLLYTGRAALARAREIRAAQAAAAREPTPDELDELMDLMELATSS